MSSSVILQSTPRNCPAAPWQLQRVRNAAAVLGVKLDGLAQVLNSTMTVAELLLGKSTVKKGRSPFRVQLDGPVKVFQGLAEFGQGSRLRGMLSGLSSTHESCPSATSGTLRSYPFMLSLDSDRHAHRYAMPGLSMSAESPKLVQ